VTVRSASTRPARPTTLATLVVLLVALLVALTGCQADTEPGLQPADDTTTATPTEAEEQTEEQTGSGDPLTFGSSGRVTIRCFPRGERRMVVLDSVTTDRPVSLRRLEAGGDALAVSGAWVRALAEREVTEGGLIDLRPGLTVPERWPGAEPLRGAALEPGARYSFYVLGRVTPDARFADLTVDWADDETTGTSTYSFGGRTRSGGC
jgi:hypothetical protein